MNAGQQLRVQLRLRRASGIYGLAYLIKEMNGFKNGGKS